MSTLQSMNEALAYVHKSHIPSIDLAPAVFFLSFSFYSPSPISSPPTRSSLPRNGALRTCRSARSYDSATHPNPPFYPLKTRRSPGPMTMTARSTEYSIPNRSLASAALIDTSLYYILLQFYGVQTLCLSG